MDEGREGTASLRIRQLIDEVGITVEELAERADIDEERLTAILLGDQPSMTELRKIAKEFNLSVSDLLSEGQSAAQTALLFRQTIQSRPGRRTIKAPIDDFSRRVGQSLEILTEPKTTVDWNALRLEGQDYAAATDAASRFRDLLFEGNQITPLLELPSIAVEQMGTILFLVRNSEFEGASAMINGHPFVFVSRRTFQGRMLFTLAHEIGHLVAHHETASFAVVDVPGDTESMRPRRRTEEAFADWFASCLLLPQQGVGLALRAIRRTLGVQRDAVGDIELLYLARFFGVSFQAAAKRCEDLGLIPTGGAISLYEHISKLHGNPERYATELGLPERAHIDFPTIPPHLLRDAVEGIREGRVSVGRAADILRLSLTDIFRINAGAWQTP